MVEPHTSGCMGNELHNIWCRLENKFCFDMWEYMRLGKCSPDTSMEHGLVFDQGVQRYLWATVPVYIVPRTSADWNHINAGASSSWGASGVHLGSLRTEIGRKIAVDKKQPQQKSMRDQNLSRTCPKSRERG